MEKTIQITIASTVFSVTEEAYAKLNAYLETLKAHFVGESESAEIIRDIESRIAEKLLHKKHDVITDADIAAVIAEIGDASEFEDESEAHTEHPKQAQKKLYRDMENAKVAGVCAGLGNYFDINPNYLRLAFLASLGFGGAGIFVYIILWIAMPEAKSTSQKLEMQGRRVDLHGIAQTVKERVEDVRESGAIAHVGAALHGISSTIARIIGRIVGFFLMLGSFGGLIGLTIALGIVLTNWNAPYNDFPLREAVSQPLLLGGFVVGYFAILIPLILVFALGLRMARRANALPSSVGFGLIGLWALFLVAGGVLGTKIAGEFYEYTQTAPAYQTETRTIDVPAFASLDVHNARITLRNGESQSVTVEGRALDSAEVSAAVTDGTLSLSVAAHEERLCIFCSFASPEIIVTTPRLSAVKIVDGVIYFDSFAQDAFALSAESSSIRGGTTVASLTADIKYSSFYGDLASDTLSLKSADSSVHLDGSAKHATISLSDSSFEARGLAVQDASISADRSHAEVNVSGKLEHPLLVNSSLTNISAPEGQTQMESYSTE
jgi:phage shock protein PspC (stress-responsive transcriptional regulator)